MQQVLYSELKVDGGKKIDNEIPKPKIRKDGITGEEAGEPEYYRDIAIIAVPTPKNDSYKTDNTHLKAGFRTISTPPARLRGGNNAFKMLPVTSNPAPDDAINCQINTESGFQWKRSITRHSMRSGLVGR